VVPLFLTLAQCGKAPNADALAANAQISPPGDTFEDRFPSPSFRDRFPTPQERFEQKACAGLRSGALAADIAHPGLLSRCLARPQLPYQRPAGRDELTTLVSMKSSAFPYYGNNPASEAPFLNIAKGDRRGHRSYSDGSTGRKPHYSRR